MDRESSQSVCQNTGKRSVRLTAENIASVLDRYETFLLDCDGVLWPNAAHGDKFDGIKESVERLRWTGKRLMFVSNNPRNTPESLQEKFKNMCGFTADCDDIIIMNDALVSYLRDDVGVKGKVYLFGSKQTQDALEEAGFPVVGFGENPEPPVGDLNTGLRKLVQLKLDENVGAVVVSHDGFYDYNKLFKAANYLCDPKCAFVATSDESHVFLEVPGGRKLLIPITGSLLASVEKASSRQAHLVGKPSPFYFRYAQRLNPDLDPKRAVMVGDMLVSDVAFAANCGMDSILVSTGVDNEETITEAVKQNPNVALPTYIMDSFADIAKLMTE